MLTIEDEDITNEGKVYVALKHYEKEINPFTLDDKDRKRPPYSYKLFAMSSTGPAKQYDFQMAGLFIEGTRQVYNNDGQVQVAGLYKAKANGNITGIFHTHFDSRRNVLQ